MHKRGIVPVLCAAFCSAQLVTRTEYVYRPVGQQGGGGTFSGVVPGMVLAAGSAALLWWNEGRSVKTYQGLLEGEKVCVEAAAESIDPANDGKLIHTSARAEASALGVALGAALGGQGGGFGDEGHAGGGAHAEAPYADRYRDTPPRLAADAQAFQPYTSGSTGLPKGAMMTHAGMLWYVDYNQRYWPTSSEASGC